MTTRSGGEDHDPEGNPYNGKYVYIGRKGLLERLEVLHDDKAATAFLNSHPANRLWRCYLGEVTEMDLTPPHEPQLIEREL